MSTFSGSDQRWVVDRAGLTLRQVLDELGAPNEALIDGRVFLNQRRVGIDQEPQQLHVGSEVLVYRARPPGGVAILSEMHDVIAVAKPAGIATQPDHRGIAHCLLGELAQLLGEKADALHALHRLDRDVSGVVLVSRNSRATAWVEQARERGAFHRRYLAIASGHLVQATGTWNDAIGQGKRPGLRRVGGPNAKPALSRYQQVAAIAARQVSLLMVEPATGRTHQIRVHAAHAGVPLLGDGDYGGQRRVVNADGSVHALARIALHALKVALPLPDGTNWNIVAPPPAELLQLWQALGGNAADLDALSDRAWL
ncbi:MAG TPA: RluA family pseudouridine synthase [Polyangiaceae bacterium]|nr:RluA family pseudouridine synthase [Polyangiaceae bacterium]